MAGILFAALTGRWLLLLIDLAGPLLMLALVRRPLLQHGRTEALLMDLLVAWPAVTAVAVFLAAGRP